MGRISLVVSPGARRTELVGRYGEAWKARVAAPPEDGRANAALEELVASLLGVPRADVSVVAGRTSRRKIVEVRALDTREAMDRVEAALAGRR